MLATGLALFGLAAAGCGGGEGAPTVANLAATTATGGTTATSGPAKATPSTAALAACLTQHGFPPSTGSSGNVIKVFGVTLGNVDPDSPQFDAAMKACQKFLPDGGPPQLTPAQQAARRTALATFAACMRKHGVANFPDPNGKGRFPQGSLGKFDPDLPGFHAADTICEPLVTKAAPRVRFG